jgi:dipicolinate synthase subunit A
MKFILPCTKDLRLKYLAEKAEKEGYESLTSETIPPQTEGVFFLPFGIREEELLAAFTSIPERSRIFCGTGTESVKRKAKEKNHHVTFLLEEKSSLTKNARHTAEGVLAEIIAKTDRRLDDLCLLVYGYGNCGSAIAKLLWLCGCEIWVWSRERGQALAEKDGFNVFPAPVKGLSMFDGVINTVPDSIFSQELLSTMQRGSSFFQVASGTSGIDAKKMEKAGVNFVPLHGLPGKYTPLSEADAIWDEITQSPFI